MERKLFLCAKEAATVDSKHPTRRKKVHQATTIGLKSKILEQCQKRNDKWSVEVETRLSCSMDLVANEGIYHSECLSRFMSFKPLHERNLGFSGRPTDLKLLASFNNLCNWLQNEADGELYSVRDLHAKMKELAGNGEEVYSAVWLKKKLKERYKDSIYFTEIDGVSDVACFKEMASYILNDAWYKERKEDKKTEAECIIQTAAKLIMADIRERKYDVSNYPTQLLD